MQGWGAFAKLAYSSAAMGCLENWAFGSISLIAGNLPDPTSAVAAAGVAFAIYGFLFMGFGALGRAVCVRSAFVSIHCQPPFGVINQAFVQPLQCLVSHNSSTLGAGETR